MNRDPIFLIVHFHDFIGSFCQLIRKADIPPPWLLCWKKSRNTTLKIWEKAPLTWWSATLSLKPYRPKPSSGKCKQMRVLIENYQSTTKAHTYIWFYRKDKEAPWHKEFKKNQRRILINLHVLHPALRQCLSICKDHLNTTTLANCSGFR